MEAQEFSIHAKNFAAEQKRRKLSRIELMIHELSSSVAELDKQIAAEEQRVGINNPRRVAYSTHAKAGAQRRDNLLRTIETLKRMMNQATGDEGSGGHA